MADLKKLNKTVRRATKARKSPQTEEIQKLDVATMEVLNSMTKAVEAFGDKIDGIQQPIVNVPVRKPSSYTASFQRNSRGDMISARFDPVE